MMPIAVGDRRLCHRFLAILSALFIVLPAASIPASAEPENGAAKDSWEERLERLRSVPYVGVSEEPAGQTGSGVVSLDPKKVCRGYFLYCHRLTGNAFLIDEFGDVIHNWTFDASRKKDFEEAQRQDDYTVMLENGDLLVMKKFMEVIRLDWNSRVLWQKTLPVHHELTPAPDGSLYLLLLDLREYRGLDLRNDIIAHLTGDGEEIDRWVVHDHLRELKRVLDNRLFLDTLLDQGQAAGGRNDPVRKAGRRMTLARTGKQPFDYFHINTITVIPPTPLEDVDDRFRAGNLLICMRNINQIAVLEKGTYRPLWSWGADELQWPHHSTMLNNGHILLFDNGINRKYSRVLEIDPLTEAIVWRYQSDPPGEFFSDLRGSAQRLPNGNTLICESNRGRAFQVTPEGEVVWEWMNPRTEAFSGGEQRRETVYRMLFYPAESVDPLFTRWW
jgi:hypothetical protein